MRTCLALCHAVVACQSEGGGDDWDICNPPNIRHHGITQDSWPLVYVGVFVCCRWQSCLQSSARGAAGRSARQAGDLSHPQQQPQRRQQQQERRMRCLTSRLLSKIWRR